MKTSKLSFLLFSLSFILSAGDLYAADCYRLYLTDKSGADYCALSQRSMQRRERQGIALDSTDLCVSPVYKSALQEKGWQIVTESRWLNTVVVRRKDDDPMDAETLAQFPFVASVEQVTSNSDLPTLASSKFRLAMPAPNVSVPQDDFHRPMYEVHGEVLSAMGFRGQGMLVTVLDGGFKNLDQYSFLFDKVVGWYDCYEPADEQGLALWNASTHGTHVLSIMATDSLYNVWGTAPESDYFLIRTEYEKTESPLEEDMWVHGAEMADSIGADLINSSLGYYSFDHSDFDHPWESLRAHKVFVSRGAAMACRKGILVCNAAGNERQKPWQTINFPADEELVFTIGATDIDLQPGLFTSAGWTAPYVKPDVSCRGVESWIINSNTGTPSVGNGTSYACPFMCGLMASLWSANPRLSPSELKQIVRESASQFASPDSLVGYGLPDFGKALAVVRPDLVSLSSVEPKEEEFSTYNLQGQFTRRHGLCIHRHKVVFVR